MISGSLICTEQFEFRIKLLPDVSGMPVMLSIIIPTFNRSGLLREALDSILEQTSSSIEIVVADDASTDDTQAVCEEFKIRALLAGMDFLMIKAEVNKGAPFLRNEGFRQSSGAVVMFMDSDDVLERGVIRQVLPEFRDPEVDFVYGKVGLVDAALAPLPGEIVGAPYTRCGRDIAGYHWQTMGAIYRRELIERVGPWQEELTGSQDWEFQARVKMAASKWRFLDVFIGLWRQHTGPRVGTASFRLDYVQSVGKACVMVLDSAAENALLDQALKDRLAFKLIVHAAELEVHGHAEDRKCFLSRAFELLPKTPANFVFKWIMALVPKWGSRMLLFVFAAVRRFRRKPQHIFDSGLPRAESEFVGLADSKISIMITTKNRRDELLRTLKVLKQLNPSPFEVLITADGCTDDTAEVVGVELPEAVLFVNEVSLGSVGSRARMMRVAEGDLVLSLDDDSYPEQMDCLATLAMVFEGNPRLAVATFPQRTDEYPETLTQKDFGVRRPIRSFPNSGACFRAYTYRQLAGFETVFFHAYEETDYALQCIASNWDIVLVPEITIRHHFTRVMRSEIRTHQRHARNELWSTLMRCPFPQAFGVIIYRIFSQGFYAGRRGPSWLIREPIWWWQALKGAPIAIKKRCPVSWDGYRKWVSLPD